MSTIFIFHGTEGYPGENWFPWLKKQLEGRGHRVFVPQFPSPPVVPAKINEWFEVFKNYEDCVDDETIFVGHSLGGVFLLRLLEQLDRKVHAAIFVGTPIGIRPILNYDRDCDFSGFSFDWKKIQNSAQRFSVFQSDDDPYVGLENGRDLAKNLQCALSFIPHAGHFNAKAGYLKFDELLESLQPFLGTK